MRRYFHGQKRRFGVLALFASCATTIAWLHSLEYYGSVELQNEFSEGSDVIALSRLVSENGIISIESKDRIFCVPRSKLDGPAYHISQIEYVIVPREQGYIEDYRISTAIEIPYCYIVTPLTLISAWCLLTKRRSKRATIAAT
jgi:hypothetical protein